MAEQSVTRVTFGDREYGITFFEDRFGVCRNGYGRVKYMPVVWKYSVHCFPELHKTRLSLAGTAETLHDNVSTCSRIKASTAECIQLCEHVLKYGRTPR